jgi:hypothetical protein
MFSTIKMLMDIFMDTMSMKINGTKEGLKEVNVILRDIYCDMLSRMKIMMDMLMDTMSMKEMSLNLDKMFK